MANTVLPTVERLWRAARTLRNFTTTDLIFMACSERQETINFCRALVRNGYVVRDAVTRTTVRGRLPHYRLAKDPGPNLPAEINGVIK
jgi:hypothetical protein